MILFITRYGPPLDLLFFFNDTATTEIYTLSLHDALPISWSAGGQRMSRYWTLPIDEPIYYKRADDYTDRFKELLDMAGDDRLRTNKICIFMSGGPDSPALSGAARKIFRNPAPRTAVGAFH